MLTLYRGYTVDPLRLEEYKIEVYDFIRPLSMINRYTGNTRAPYSVGEHSVLGAFSKPVVESGLSRAFLLHDFNEILTADVPRPFKRVCPDYCAQEQIVQRSIFERFNEPWDNMAKIETFDKRICQDEMMKIFAVPIDIGLEPLGVEIKFWHWEVTMEMLRLACKKLEIV